MSKSLKFHAGKVEYDEETKRCTPLPHKGVVVIKPSSEDPDFFLFNWSPKADLTVGGTVDKDELLLIPGDVRFKHVKSCKTGRVFALSFLSSQARHLYWLQDVGDIDQPELLTEKDLKIVQQVQDLIAVKDDDEEEEDDEDVETKESTSQETGSAPATLAAPAPAAAPEAPAVPIVAISDVLDLQLVEKHLDTLSPEELARIYSPVLPESVAKNPTKKDILDVFRSGFFQQAEQKLSENLRSGTGAGYLLAQSLKYDYRGEGIDGFLQGLRQLGERDDDADDKQE